MYINLLILSMDMKVWQTFFLIGACYILFLLCMSINRYILFLISISHIPHIFSDVIKDINLGKKRFQIPALATLQGSVQQSSLTTLKIAKPFM